MKHRFNNDWLDTKPMHEHEQSDLFNTIRDLLSVLEAGQTPDVVTQAHSIAKLGNARSLIEACKDVPQLFNMAEQSIAESRMYNHPDLLHWINQTSMWVKIGDWKRLTIAHLESGKRLVRELDSCRVRLRFD